MQGLTSPHRVSIHPVFGSAAQYTSRAARGRRERRGAARFAASAWLALLALGLAGPARAADPGATLRQYLQARWRGDVPAAQALWDPDELRRSQALGITYPTLEARFDDNLQLAADERAAVAAASQPVVRDSSVEASWVRFTVVVQPPASGLGAAWRDTLVYHLRPSGDAWVLTTPYRKLTAGWTAREGRFFRLRSARLRDINKDALAALDAGILAALGRLHTPEMAILRLDRIKFEYYLCADGEQVRQLTGAAAPSQYRLAGARIVTRSLLDLNALARAVVHLTLREAPPRAVPWLEEGTAAALGGWNDGSGPVTVQRGAKLVTESKVDLEALLDPGKLRAMEAAKAIPAAALWCHALIEQLGPESFVALYRGLSGSGSQVEKLAAADVRRALEKATGKRGADLLAAVRQSPAALRPPLAGGSPAVPEESATRRAMLTWRDREEKWALQAFETPEEYTFVVGPYEGPVPAWMRRVVDSLRVANGLPPDTTQVEVRPRPAGDPPQMVVLLRPRIQSEPEAYESELFHQQFAQRKYAGEVYGLFIGPDAVRLYDYRTDSMVGCRGGECAVPESHSYYDEKAGRLCFRVRHDLIADPLVSYAAVCFLYTGE